MKIFHNIYYRIYRIASGLGTNENPQENSIFVLAIISIWHFLVLWLAICFLFGMNPKRIPYAGALIVGLGWITILYIYFKKNGAAIISRYKEESAGQKTMGIWWFIIYLCITGVSSYFSIRYLN